MVCYFGATAHVKEVVIAPLTCRYKGQDECDHANTQPSPSRVCITKFLVLSNLYNYPYRSPRKLLQFLLRKHAICAPIIRLIYSEREKGSSYKRKGKILAKQLDKLPGDFSASLLIQTRHTYPSTRSISTNNLSSA